MRHLPIKAAVALATAAFLFSCGGGPGKKAPAGDALLSRFQAEQGSGPRLRLVLGQGEPVCSLLVVFPGEETPAVEGEVASLCHLLDAAHIGYGIESEARFDSLAVFEGKEGGPSVGLHGLHFKALLGVNLADPSAETLARFSDFVGMGGKAVLAGDAPVGMAATQRVPLDPPVLLRSLFDNAGTLANVLDDAGNELGSIACQVRKDEGRTFYVFANTSADTLERVKILIPLTEGFFTEWNCEDGRAYSFQPASVGPKSLVVKTFEPFQPFIVCVSGEPVAGSNILK